jgi:hypothetical protein
VKVDVPRQDALLPAVKVHVEEQDRLVCLEGVKAQLHLVVCQTLDLGLD